jgi:hypothetical protein
VKGGHRLTPGPVIVGLIGALIEALMGALMGAVMGALIMGRTGQQFR